MDIDDLLQSLITLQARLVLSERFSKPEFFNIQKNLFYAEQAREMLYTMYNTKQIENLIDYILEKEHEKSS